MKIYLQIQIVLKCQLRRAGPGEEDIIAPAEHHSANKHLSQNTFTMMQQESEHHIRVMHEYLPSQRARKVNQSIHDDETDLFFVFCNTTRN